MRRYFVVVAVLAACLVPGTAFAKGATGATIEGPGGGTGGSGPIVIGGDGEPGSGSKLSKLADQSGFWALTFGRFPDPTLDEKPAGDLGPYYTVTYEMPSPDGGNDYLVQRVYPYAPDGPVTFMTAGQKFMATEETHGGWFQASNTLKQTLVDLGLPGRAPNVTSGTAATTTTSSFAWTAVLLAGLLVVAAGAAVFVLRRRLRPSAA